MDSSGLSSSAACSTSSFRLEESNSTVNVSYVRSPRSSILSPGTCYTPKGKKEFIPSCPVELKPIVGMKFDSLNDGVKFYKNYAKECGFEVRKGTEKKEKKCGQATIIIKYLLCNMQGHIEKNSSVIRDDIDASSIRKRSVKRIDCHAGIRFRYCLGGKYMVYYFHESHSHEFATPSTRQFCKESRGLTSMQKKFIFDNARVNIGAVMSYRISKEHCGSYSNVRGTKTDYKKFSRDLKVYISDCDGFMFKDNFLKKVKNSKGGYFFYYCVDSERHLTRAFWADPIGRKNYAIFGDVISFDATYSTNKYSLVFAPFTGVDNHKKCVTFCAGFLSHEDVDSYVWLFNQFKKCMGNHQPSCILTDQVPAMEIAIARVFDKSKYRLCMWHITRKVPEKVGSVMCNETDFLKKFNKVVWDRDIEPADFEKGWNSVMVEFGLTGHTWFTSMFGIRKRWIPAYFRDIYMGGLLRVTSRSEGENNFFGNFTNPHVTCVEFCLRYESALDAQRHTQDELNKASKECPQLATPLDLEKHASSIYTHAIFYDFQHEWKAACYSCGMESCNPCYSDGVHYSCVFDNERNRYYDVLFNTTTYESSCSCKMFESEGMLCRHILFVMKGKGLTEIPEQYVLHRWTKNAHKKPLMNVEGSLVVNDASHFDKKKQLLSDAWSLVFSCVGLAEDNEDDLCELVEKFRSYEEELINRRSCTDLNVKGKSTSDIEMSLGEKPSDVDVLPPKYCLNKGSARSSNRLKSAKELAVEAKSKKGRTCKACGQSGVGHDSRNCPSK